MGDIAIAVVNYNGERFLEACIKSALEQDPPPEEVLVVDNGSSDGSVALLRSSFPQVRVLETGENLYFCRGANICIAETSAPFLLLLNNDAVLEPDYARLALEAMRRDERIGAVSGKILRADRETLDTAGQELSRSRKPLDRGWAMPDDGRFDEDEEVFGAGGVAPLLRRAMLDDVAIDGQVFDEGFVQYYEDLDLMWRARNLGWKAWYVPQAVAYHHRGGVGQSEPAQQSWVRRFAFANLPRELQRHLLKNRYATMAKNDRLLSWLAGLPWILLYELKIIAYLLLIRPSLIPGYFRGFGFLRRAFAARKRLKGMARERGIRRYGGRHVVRTDEKGRE